MKFRWIDVQVSGKERKFKVLETPTLLKELYHLDYITLNEYSEKLQTYYKALDKKYTVIEKPMHNTPNMKRLRPYQQTIVDYGSNFKSFAVFDEPRLGKTPAILKLLEKKDLLKEKIYIASPGKVTGNWIKEIKDWLNLKAIIYNGDPIPKDINIIVSTYARVRLSLNEILKWEPSVFILDEAHILRNSRGKRQRLTKAQRDIRDETGLLPVNQSILELAQAVNHRYPLTGTPTVNTPEDIFAILQFQMPNTFDSFWTFAEYYFQIGFNFMGAREILYYKSKEKEQELQELLDYCSTQHKQKDHMKWLIKPKIQIINFELDNNQLELEQNLINNAMIGDSYIFNALEHLTHYMTITTNPSTLELIENNNIGIKNRWLLQQLKDCPKDNVAIFSGRERNISSLKKKIETLMPNRKIYTLTGKSSNKKAIEIQNKINSLTKKEGVIFLGTIGTSKEGISLQGLNKAYVTDQLWTPSDMEQLFNRLNATSPENQEFFGNKEIFILHAPGTVDDVIQETLDMKISATEAINNYRKFIKNKGGIKP